jgi:Flp pilus assembly secretin CpaC
MPANLKHAFLALAILASSALAVDMPLAADGVTVNVNMARILRINSPAATVIIGNPAIADVTIQDPKTLILTGKAYGETNLIILDSIGNPIADTLVDVVQQEANLMTIYQGASRTTMVCDPVCQPTPMLGDDPNYTSTALASSNMIDSAAAGK